MSPQNISARKITKSERKSFESSLDVAVFGIFLVRDQNVTKLEIVVYKKTRSRLRSENLNFIAVKVDPTVIL